MSKRLIIQVLWLVLGLYVCTTLAKSLVQLYQASGRVATQQAKLESLKSEIAGLNSELEYVRSYSFLEKTARDKLNLQRPGEVILMVYDNHLVVQQTQTEAEQPLPFWQRWLRLFM